MPLVFLPEKAAFFLWQDGGSFAELRALGTPLRIELVTPDGRRDVDGFQLPVLACTTELATRDASSLQSIPASVAIWALAAKLALELVARERVVPCIARRAGVIEARWAAALAASDDAINVAALASSMPPAAH